MRWGVLTMKSKTFCFNLAIFKKNFTHYWPLWALHLGFLILAMPVMIWKATTSVVYLERAGDESRMYDVVKRVLDVQLAPLPIFLFAVMMALAVFSYLYSAKSAHMIHALPVDRLELYVTNYLSGLSFLVVPELLVFLISVLVCLANKITCIEYLFVGFLCQTGISFFAYTMAVFIAMFTGQSLAMPLYYLAANYLYVGCLFIVSRVIVLVGYGISDAWNPGVSCILSPVYYLGNNLRARCTYQEGTTIADGISIGGVHLVAIYGIIALIFSVAAYQLYKRRQLETAGDWVSIGILKPIFRWGVALCGGVSLALFFTEALWDPRGLNVYVCITSGVVVAGAVCFFVAEMLLQKSFHVFRRTRILEWGGFTAVAVLFITLFQIDAFGMERHVPVQEEIDAAFVYMDYPIQVESEELPALLKLHEQVIQDKRAYLALEEEGSGYYYTTFRYYLKDGSIFERRYPLPVEEEYINDVSTPSGQILAWEEQPKNLKREILGVDFGENKYVSGHIDLYDDALTLQSYTFGNEELEQLITAIEKDIEEGNFIPYYMMSTRGGERSDCYYNSLQLEYYSSNGYYDNWDYYYNYAERAVVAESAERAEGTYISSYLQFGPECVNTVKVLKRLGIVGDTWKLWTYKEYDRLSGNQQS